jgi:hypothetical protein
MARILPLVSGPLELDERRCFTPRQKAEMFKRANQRCEICGAKIRGRWIAGHIIAHALGGKTSLENGRVECMNCAKITHTDDTSTAAKCERIAGRKGQYARRKKSGPKLKSRKTEWPKRPFNSKEQRARAKEWMKGKRDE